MSDKAIEYFIKSELSVSKNVRSQRSKVEWRNQFDKAQLRSFETNKQTKSDASERSNQGREFNRSNHLNTSNVNNSVKHTLQRSEVATRTSIKNNNILAKENISNTVIKNNTSKNSIETGITNLATKNDLKYIPSRADLNAAMSRYLKATLKSVDNKKRVHVLKNEDGLRLVIRDYYDNLNVSQMVHILRGKFLHSKYAIAAIIVNGSIVWEKSIK